MYPIAIAECILYTILYYIERDSPQRTAGGPEKRLRPREAAAAGRKLKAQASKEARGSREAKDGNGGGGGGGLVNDSTPP